MVINYLICLILLTTLLYALIISPKKAFYNIYLPLLLLVPSEMISSFSGFPNFNFEQAAILPVGLGFLINSIYNYRLSYFDALVLIYSFWCLMSESVAGPKATFTLETLFQVTSVILPYMMAKSYIGYGGEDEKFSKRFVILVFIVACLMPYEIRMMTNPFKAFFSSIFTFQETEMVIRFGFRRFEGPYTHAILTGVFMSVAFLINIWLIRNKLWKKTFRWFPYIAGFMIFLALLFTFSRGPLYSLILSLSIFFAGFSKSRIKTILFASFGTLLASIVIYNLISPYFLENQVIVGDEDWNSFTYRVNLITVYGEQVMNSPLVGWGNIGWDMINNITSIDNHYLWLALRHGLVAVFLLVAIMVLTITKLIYKGFKFKNIYYRSLYSCLTGCLVLMLIVFSTVFMGGQTESLLFLIVGWAHGLMLRKKELVNA